MTFDYTLAGLVTAGPACLPSFTRSCGRNGSEGQTHMTLIGWIQIALFCAVVVALVKPLGWYMTRVFSGEKTFLSPILRPVETGLYKIAGVDDRSEQDWLRYTVSMLLSMSPAFSFFMRCSACKARCRSIPRA